MTHHTEERTTLTQLASAVNDADGSGSAQPRHREQHRQVNWLRDVILGGQDGLVNILGIVLGVIAGGGSKTVLLAAGSASSSGTCSTPPAPDPTQCPAAAHNARGQRTPGRECWLLYAYELPGTPAKVNFCSAELVAVEGQNFSVHALAAIRVFCLVGDDDFIAGLDESNKFEHSAFSRAGPATFKIPCAVQVRVRWSGKGKIVRQVFLNEMAVTLGESAVILFCDFDSTAHAGSPPCRNRRCYHDDSSENVRFRTPMK